MIHKNYISKIDEMNAILDKNNYYFKIVLQSILTKPCDGFKLVISQLQAQYFNHRTMMICKKPIDTNIFTKTLKSQSCDVVSLKVCIDVVMYLKLTQFIHI